MPSFLPMPSFTCSSAPIRNSVMAFCFRVSSRNDLVATPIEKNLQYFHFLQRQQLQMRATDTDTFTTKGGERGREACVLASFT